MLKKKLKKLVESKPDEKKTEFEILSKEKAYVLQGGCDVLNRCRKFKGDCPGLSKCGVFVEQ